MACIKATWAVFKIPENSNFPGWFIIFHNVIMVYRLIGIPPSWIIIKVVWSANWSSTTRAALAALKCPGSTRWSRRCGTCICCQKCQRQQGLEKLGESHFSGQNQWRLSGFHGILMDQRIGFLGKNLRNYVCQRQKIMISWVSYSFSLQPILG